MKSHFRSVVSSAVLAIASMVAAPAFAQAEATSTPQTEADQGDAGAIIVTATRRA